MADANVVSSADKSTSGAEDEIIFEGAPSESFHSVGYRDDESDLIKIGPGRDVLEPLMLVMTGALIHIDIDCGGSFTHEKALEHVKEVFEANPDFRGSVYRTFSGVRVLLTHRIAWPKDATRELTAFGKIDELYALGCLEQNRWSIRLTPKPGRAEKQVCRFEGRQYPLGDELAESFVAIHDAYCCAVHGKRIRAEVATP